MGTEGDAQYGVETEPTKERGGGRESGFVRCSLIVEGVVVHSFMAVELLICTGRRAEGQRVKGEGCVGELGL